jgi:hypothetical protein
VILNAIESRSVVLPLSGVPFIVEPLLKSLPIGLGHNFRFVVGHIFVERVLGRTTKSLLAAIVVIYARLKTSSRTTMDKGH